MFSMPRATSSARGPRPSIPRRGTGSARASSFPGGSAWGKHSTPAGHVANIAACASFLHYRFSNNYVTVPAYAVALGVGVGRLVDRRHWTSDTVLGALFGYAVGKEVATRSLDRGERETEGGPSGNGAGGALFFAPDANGLVVGWSISF